jgi:hypothetical protein
MGTPRSSLPDELQNVATTEDISMLEGKVNNCYSKDRYEDFQEAVEKIVHKELTTDTVHDKLNAHIDTRVEKIINERGWKNKNFWIPTVIASIAAIAAVAALFK